MKISVGEEISVTYTNSTNSKMQYIEEYYITRNSVKVAVCLKLNWNTWFVFEILIKIVQYV